MVDLETINALDSMMYIVDLDTYELLSKDEKCFNDFMNKC